MDIPVKPAASEKARINQATEAFRDYVASFYGPRGVYDMGATPAQIAEATALHAKFLAANNAEFCGDTFDRERVRDIMIEKFGLVFPQPKGGG